MGGGGVVHQQHGEMNIGNREKTSEIAKKFTTNMEFRTLEILKIFLHPPKIQPKPTQTHRKTREICQKSTKSVPKSTKNPQKSTIIQQKSNKKV
jgi:hypothetical protein